MPGRLFDLGPASFGLSIDNGSGQEYYTSYGVSQLTKSTVQGAVERRSYDGTSSDGGGPPT
jgi:hypothetical protein